MGPDALLVPQPTLEDFPDFVSIPIRIAQHAKAFPDKQCYQCHLEHGSVDNVFVQFYPTLKKVHDRRQGK